MPPPERTNAKKVQGTEKPGAKENGGMERPGPVVRDGRSQAWVSYQPDLANAM
jgi:hypothetical protein